MTGIDLPKVVGAEGFEPPTLWSQTRCATRLRYAPTGPAEADPEKVSSRLRRMRAPAIIPQRPNPHTLTRLVPALTSILFALNVALLPAGACRTFATALTIRSTGSGVSLEITTTCAYDKTTNKSTCTSKSRDSRGESTTVAVTSFSSVDDVIAETQVIPPLRRSLRTETTIREKGGSRASSLVNSYDGKGRLVREVGSADAILKRPVSTTKYTTTYTSWDSKGRPTAGTTAHPGGRTTTAIAYNDAARTQTTTSVTGGQRTVCQMTFDASGNAIATSCTVGGIAQTQSKTTINKTDTICR